MRSFSQVATGPAFRVRAPLPIPPARVQFRSWLEFAARVTGDGILGERICSILVRGRPPATYCRFRRGVTHLQRANQALDPFASGANDTTRDRLSDAASCGREFGHSVAA